MITDLTVSRKMVTLSNNATKREAGFSMSFKRVKQLLMVKKCYYTGVDLVEEDGPNQRSFDKINPDLGYTDSNVVVCCKDINQKKANLSFDEIELLYKKLMRLKK